MSDLLHPKRLRQLRGHEALAPGRTVLDFWRWALGDLRMNTARGYLVEYLVAQALKDETPVRVEWGPYDARGLDGTLVEIKTAGYLQSWVARRRSTPSWSFKSVRADRVWSDEQAGYLPVDPATRVHVWVFALQKCDDPDEYDPLRIDQWEFRVMPHRALLATGQTSARLPFFDNHGVKSVNYDGVADAVNRARLENDQLAGDA